MLCITFYCATGLLDHKEFKLFSTLALEVTRHSSEAPPTSLLRHANLNLHSSSLQFILVTPVAGSISIVPVYMYVSSLLKLLQLKSGMYEANQPGQCLLHDSSCLSSCYHNHVMESQCFGWQSSFVSTEQNHTLRGRGQLLDRTEIWILLFECAPAGMVPWQLYCDKSGTLCHMVRCATWVTG